MAVSCRRWGRRAKSEAESVRSAIRNGRYSERWNRASLRLHPLFTLLVLATYPYLIHCHASLQSHRCEVLGTQNFHSEHFLALTEQHPQHSRTAAPPAPAEKPAFPSLIPAKLRHQNFHPRPASKRLDNRLSRSSVQCKSNPGQRNTMIAKKQEEC